MRVQVGQGTKALVVWGGGERTRATGVENEGDLLAFDLEREPTRVDKKSYERRELWPRLMLKQSA